MQNLDAVDSSWRKTDGEIVRQTLPVTDPRHVDRYREKRKNIQARAVAKRVSDPAYRGRGGERNKVRHKMRQPRVKITRIVATAQP